MATHLKNLSDFSHIQVPSGSPFRIGIVVSSWNFAVTGKLFQGALDTLFKHGVAEENIISVDVAGSYELIVGADLLLSNKDLDAVICLGCVIQGETRHFDFICNAVATGLAQVGIKHTKPVVFGVLTTDNQEQALDRAGGKHGNKGDEAAITAIKIAQLHKSLKK